MEATRRRAYGWSELEIFHPMGRQVPSLNKDERNHKRHKRHMSLGYLCFLWFLLSAPGFAQSDKATPRTDQNSLTAHTQLVEKAKSGRIDIYFEGDSITRRWGATDYPE